MADICRVIMNGRLTRDIEVSHSQSGYAIGKLSIAVNRRVKKGEEWVDEASFFDCVIFGKRAESLAPYLLKGQQVTLDGQPKQDRWESDGQKRSKVVFNIDNIQLLGKNEASKPASQPSNQSYQSANPEPAFEDDIPF